ncbi:mannose-1-phosphate guanylyltransferase [Microbacterium amylolyticum]|uniref:Mannose-1-phosphate guanylyltransferase n=1 Tax=Microbacterium amylolyticum TaxID=936337 RepID=A0ABS4ZJR2_9MICO|nr:mannose-1-phosphate guanylyltransferase [Microbacterium amylolyticum]MBP2437527.1 mannose-1-phosphate guanylyltransferase [Microbacterium amylolyticum]
MSQPIDDFFAVIPAGGIGSRLWPLSRAESPKFLHDLTGEGSSLLRTTWDRLLPLAGPGRISVVTGRAHGDKVEESLGDIDLANVFIEQEPRDSAAAIGLAAAILERRHPGVIIGSFAADHVIKRQRVFEFTVRQAVAAAREGYIATIGIQPSEPAVGFGYIKTGQELIIDEAPMAALVERFVEKPDLETARQYFADRSYLWNAGMFISRADVLLEELRINEPELHDGLVEIAAAWDTDARDEVVDRVWPTLKKIAIDYAVAEPAADKGRLAVIPGQFDWDDVGDFASLWTLISGGVRDGVTVLGENTNVLSDDASALVVSQTDRVVALIGVENVIVVDTPDALLVTTPEHAQRVKSAVNALHDRGQDDVL